MLAFLRRRSPSLSTVVLVLVLIVVMQGGVSYTLTFGRLEKYVPAIEGSPIATTWIAVRLVLVATAAILWLLGRKADLFRVIIIANSALTVSLAINMIALADALTNLATKAVDTLILDVLLMAVSNILIFSIWYWIIDPPGVTEDPRDADRWDFLFPQRQAALPGYENWMPRYSDYLYVAFTTSLTFSPSDTQPLSRRAKMLMLLQAAISIVTLTAIAGGAINILAGSS